MRQFIETHLYARVLQWNEPTEDGVVFSALQHGRFIVTDSLTLLLAALQESPPEAFAMAA